MQKKIISNLLPIVIVALAGLSVFSSISRAADYDIDVAALEHPYILFDKADIPQLAQRAKTPPFKYIWENLTQRSPEKTDGVVNAFIYAITGDIERGRAAQKTLADLCALPSWGRQPKLEVSSKCRPAGLIYDMIYDLLTPVERQTFADKIAKAGIIRLYDDTFQAWWSHRRQHNYSPVFNSAYGIAAMAILKEKPEANVWIKRAAERVQLFLRSQCPSGGFGEGVNYWCMSLRNIFPFMDGLKNHFDLDLYAEPWLTDTTPLFVLYCLSPDRRSTLSFNDAGINRKYDAHVMVRLASACRQPQIAWVIARDIAGTPAGAIEFDWPGAVPQAPGEKPRAFGLGDIFSFLWYDPKVPTAPLDKLPRSHYFGGIGWTVMRSGWDQNALQFGITSAPKFFGNHEHADRGSIIFNAYGERLICDAGKPATYGDPIIEDWFRGSNGHSLLFVNGTGQTMREKLSDPGRMSRFITTEHFDYVLTENAGPYDGRVKRWDRHALYAAPEFVILFDQVQLPQSGDIEFRYHSPGSRKILLQDNDAIFPGDNKDAIPGIPRGTAQAKAKYGKDYEQTDWWKTGNPLPEITDWTAEEEQNTDLIVRTFSLTDGKQQIHSGYQDYRTPATYLAQSYENIEHADFITLLYPRSTEMKKYRQTPRITDLSSDSFLAVKVVRTKKHHIIAARAGADEVTVEQLSFNADLAAVALSRDGQLEGSVMVNGTQLKYAEKAAIVADLPLTAIATFQADHARIVFEVPAPSGADLRLKLPSNPLNILLDGKPVFASITPKNNSVELHIPTGRSEVRITCAR